MVMIQMRRLGMMFCAAMLGAVSVVQAAAVQQVPLRTISADLNVVKGPHCTTFRACVGAGCVAEGLGAEWQKQLKLCRDELGFESLRCHGVLSDRLGVYTEDKQGNPHYNFQYIDLVYDYLESIGVRPFVELSFMPDDLATIRSEKAGPDGMAPDPNHPGQKRKVTVFMRRSNVTPPKSVKKWKDLITALVQHWTDRYGTDEVKHWRFEVWNEPNHHSFFSPNDNSKRMEEYFALYAETAKAIMRVNPTYQVGGPASAGPAWIPQLIAFTSKNKLPLDFISFHAYGVHKGTGFDESGKAIGLEVINPHQVSHTANSQFAAIAKSAKPKLPVCITEWSTSYSSRSPIHDDYVSAPYILEQIKNTESLAAMSYWTFTDIFEETGIPPTPFHGGFGLLNVQGIKKPAYFAFRFMNFLGSKELVNADKHSWVCKDANGGASALFWDLTLPSPKIANLYLAVRPSFLKENVLLKLKSLRPGKYHLKISTVGFERNDTYTAYLKMGAPNNLSPSQVTALKADATGQPQEQSDVVVSADGTWAKTFPLRTNDAVLVQLTPQKSRWQLQAR